MMGIARLSSCSRRCARSRALRGDSFLHGESRPWVPKCPSPSGVDSEWQLLGEATCPLTQLFPSPSCPSPSCSPSPSCFPHPAAPHPAVASCSHELTRDLCLQRGSPAPPCGLLPLLGRLARPPGTAVSHEMRRGPSSRRALLSRRLECGGVHAHAPAQGRRVQRDAALLGSWLCQPSARPQLRDNSCPLELCVTSVEPGRAG